MAKQARFWSVDNRLAEISAGGDPMETLNATVDFERLRPPEGSDGADHPDHRYGARQCRNHDGQHGLQH